MGGLRNRQRLTQAGVGQADIVVHVIHPQLLASAVRALTERVDPTPHCGHPLADVEVEAFDQPC
jgi:hypothetical protein